MKRIFISYRSEDAAYVVNLIKDELQSHYGDVVFTDFDEIPFGVDFRASLEKALSRCEVFLAVIGSNWINIKDKKGQRRLDDPKDHLRIEIETALQREIPIIPLLVGGAGMPAADELPDSLENLSFRNAMSIRAGRDLKTDMALLTGALKPTLAEAVEQAGKHHNAHADVFRKETKKGRQRRYEAETAEMELEPFRQDVKEKEREIQKYVGIYLLILSLVGVSVIMASNSGSLIQMVLGNYGYNVYALLILLVVNTIYICILIYKSLIIHEIMQFVTLTSNSESGLKWEVWRHSPLSATKKVRAVFTIIIAILPVMVSVFGIYILWHLIYSDPQRVLFTLNELSASNGLPRNPITPEQISRVFASAKISFWIVVLLHIIPLWFFYENAIPNESRWSIINSKKRSIEFEKSLKEGFPFTSDEMIVNEPEKSAVDQGNSNKSIEDMSGNQKKGDTESKT